MNSFEELNNELTNTKEKLIIFEKNTIDQKFQIECCKKKIIFIKIRNYNYKYKKIYFIVQKKNKESKENFDKLENNHFVLEHKFLKNDEERVKINKIESINLKDNNEKFNELNEKLKNFETKSIKRLEFLEEKIRIFDDQISNNKKENSKEVNEQHTIKNNPDKLRIEIEKLEFRVNEITRNNRSNEDNKKTINEISEKLNKFELDNENKFEE
jgi:hypothetical protein